MTLPAIRLGMVSAHPELSPQGCRINSFVESLEKSCTAQLWIFATIAGSVSLGFHEGSTPGGFAAKRARMPDRLVAIGELHQGLLRSFPLGNIN